MKIAIKLARLEAKKRELRHELYMHETFPEVYQDVDNFKAIKSIIRKTEQVDVHIAKVLKEMFKVEVK